MTTYRKFISQRDEYLEEYLRKANLRIYDVTTHSLEHIEHVVASVFARIEHKRFTSEGRFGIMYLQAVVDENLSKLAVEIADIIAKMAKLTAKLSYYGEKEGLARKLGKTTDLKTYEPETNRFQYLSWASISLEKLSSKIKIAIERAYINEESAQLAIERIKAVMPPTKTVHRKTLIKTPVMEAEIARDKKYSATVDSVNDDDWQELVDEYKSEHIPKYRYYDRERTGQEKYSWEIEQAATEEFLAKVKDGTVKAANDLGVTDFMWVAVLDDRTRPEHAKRDGLTSTEIQAKLNDEWSDDEDKGIVAPSGFNCRCRSVPYVPDKDEDTTTDFQAGDFFSWINGP